MKRKCSTVAIFGKFPPSTSSGTSSTPPIVFRRPCFFDSLMEETIENAHILFAQWDVLETPMFCDDASEARQYLQSVKDLQAVMQRLIKRDTNSELLLRPHNLMLTAITRLEKEFHRILSSNFGHSSNLEPDDQESVTSVSGRSDLASSVADLKAIAECVIAAGYGKECIRLYKSVGESIIEEELNRVGLSEMKSSKKKKKMDREVLEKNLKSWLTVVQVAVRSIFCRERILSSRVFSCSPKIGKSCFSEITRSSVIRVFQFEENVGRHLKRAPPEKIYSTLDTYEAITDLWTELELAFSSDSTSVVQPHYDSALSKTKAPGGGVYPLTKFVMNYLSFLSDYIEVLQDIVVDWPLNVKAPLPDWSLPASTGTSGLVYSAASTRLAWLILILLSKLDTKAELFKGDVALSYLFLANNLQCVVVKVRDSNLRYLLGEEWITNHELKVKHYAANYERIIGPPYSAHGCDFNGRSGQSVPELQCRF
ncbi:hypothetical protein CRG98_043170 [Punica granatum]|uniref:Exocyst subunit Exo70 family protein n=1 Tax=Punica granatum TaxID=22663 RepID=A0A2I0HXH2_PUNGR|nr:hypothetical protein CRG98_043170 [Punica granatum]